MISIVGSLVRRLMKAPAATKIAFILGSVDKYPCAPAVGRSLGVT